MSNFNVNILIMKDNKVYNGVIYVSEMEAWVDVKEYLQHAMSLINDRDPQFELRYRQGSTEHRFLNKFKQCFLQDISINYTGEGNYATYGDGTPISMIMDLTFKELEPIYDIDYDDPITGLPRDSTVGY